MIIFSKRCLPTQKSRGSYLNGTVTKLSTADNKTAAITCILYLLVKRKLETENYDVLYLVIKTNNHVNMHVNVVLQTAISFIDF